MLYIVGNMFLYFGQWAVSLMGCEVDYVLSAHTLDNRKEREHCLYVCGLFIRRSYCDDYALLYKCETVVSVFTRKTCVPKRSLDI